MSENLEAKRDMVVRARTESDLLYVDASGEFSLVDAKQIFLEILETVAQHKSRKVLFDGRRLTGNPRVMERFFMVNSLRRQLRR